MPPGPPRHLYGAMPLPGMLGCICRQADRLMILVGEDEAHECRFHRMISVLTARATVMALG